MSARKRRGTSVERSIVNKLRNAGFACIRAPASGSHSRSYVPDIIALRKGTISLIEAKSTRKDRVYIPKEQIDGLKIFSDLSGGEGFIAVKYKDYMKVYRLCELKQTKSGRFTVEPEEGMDLDGFIRWVESKISRTLDNFV